MLLPQGSTAIMSSVSASRAFTATYDLTRRPRQVAVDYLKATVILLVVAHHNCLACTTFPHFDPAHYLTGSIAPAVATSRWGFFDYAENFNDVFFMSLMFFISRLFVCRSLRG